MTHELASFYFKLKNSENMLLVGWMFLTQHEVAPTDLVWRWILKMNFYACTLIWEKIIVKYNILWLLQVETFIKAIFADSPLRKECLQRIKSASD